MNFADAIKSRLTAKQVFDHYGFTVNRAGFCRCPFHAERTPSCKVYDDSEKGYYCYGCHRGGDIINFVKDYFGVSFYAAQEKLNEDFSLALPIGDSMYALSEEQRNKAFQAAHDRKRRRQRYENEKRKIAAEYDEALTEYCDIDITLMALAGWKDISFEEVCSVYAEPLKRKATADYRLAEAEANLFSKSHNAIDF